PHPEQAGAAVTDVDEAMETARSAVAAAAAAAAAAIAEAQERPRRPATEGLRFEQRSEQMARSFLADTAAPAESDPSTTAVDAGNGAADDDALPADPSSGLDFEPRHPAHHGFGRPEALPEPRDGGPDNLKQIKGVTPALEASLHGLGIFHFDQIAAWDQKAVVWVDNHLSLRGRIRSEKWIEKARELSDGKGRTPRPVRR
ncbi:MAG TPA: hypothetical protein VM491_14985, partial [Burkholderiaceae bacterium]|nr:hypothetical protein [Burkholderiaceae bacterium]